MAYEFKLPDLGEGLTEGEVARWLVEEGQEIAEDDPLVEVQTDKATVEIPSPASGKVARILVREGEVVAVGTVLVVIGEDDGAASRSAPEVKKLALADAPPAPPRPKGAPVRATPLVRRIASELDVDLASVPGTGPQGRVTEEDVRSAVTSGGQSLEPDGHKGVTEGRRIPLRGTRRVIAEHMARAHREVPPVTWVEECDFGDVALDRLVATVLVACALALKEFPELNARLEGNEIVELDRYDLGVAVQTGQGLVVPVVRGCDTRSVDELDADVRRLAEAARAGKLGPEELRGSTFTLTSAGKLGGFLQTPIVNYPEVAILSIGRIGERPVVRDGEIVARPVGMIAITFDHRVVDGARAAEFGLDVIRRLEQGEG
jgi:pyruvate dehydrogenase E2 component (dihydrolipoamide acetyltransferase)